VNSNAKSRRRWLGAVCLLCAIAMLIVGETVLKGRMEPLPLVTYWSSCLILTAVAAGIAVIDASRVRSEQRDEHRALIENTLQEIEREKRSRRDRKA